MATVFFLRVAALLVAPTLAAFDDLQGSAECPCFNHTQSVYGFGCKSHDVNGSAEYSECNLASPPAWCGDSWCYVDMGSCGVTHEASTTYEGLGWSYTTCGFRDLFSRSNITESLRGQTLRVQFLGNTGGWKGNYCTGQSGQPCVDQRGHGPVQRFFDLVSGSAGIKVEQVADVPGAVYAQLERMGQRSKFDLCIWATGMGFLDVCVASLVVLPRRADASPFVHLWSEPTILVGPLVQQAEDTTFAEMLGAAFRPFSPNLWLTLLAVVTSSSLIITYFETSPNGQFNDLHSRREKATEAVYRAFYSLFMCESRFEPVTLGGRIVGLGLAFMCILFVCGYTATLASFLVEERRLATNVESLADAIRLNYKICAHPSHTITLQVNGVSDANIVSMSVRSEILPSVGTDDSSVCQVAVLSEEDFVAAQASNGGSFCNLQPIGGSLGSHAVGLSVSEKWARQLGYAVSSAFSDGHVQRSLNEYRPTDYCSAINQEILQNAQPEALTVQGMLGPFVVTMSFTFFGIVAHVARAALFKTIEEGSKIRQHGFRDGLKEVADDIQRAASDMLHFRSEHSNCNSVEASVEVYPEYASNDKAAEVPTNSAIASLIRSQQSFLNIQKAEHEKSDSILRRLEKIEHALQAEREDYVTVKT